MDFACPNCKRVFRDIDESLGGEPASCDHCENEFIIPIPNSEKLLEWANRAPWECLEEGIRTGVAKGHPESVVSSFIRISEKRREQEIWKKEREAGQPVRSQQERIWQASERRLERKRILQALRAMTKGGFRELLADLLRTQYTLVEISSPKESTDLRISDASLPNPLFVKCLTNATGRKVSLQQIRSTAAAALDDSVENLLLCTPSRFTKNAALIAQQYTWIALETGRDILKRIRVARRESEFEFDARRYDPVFLEKQLELSLESHPLSKSEYDAKRQEILDRFS